MNAMQGGFVVMVIFLSVFAFVSLVTVATSALQIAHDVRTIASANDESIPKPKKISSQLIALYVEGTVTAILICIVAHFAGLL